MKINNTENTKLLAKYIIQKCVNQLILACKQKTASKNFTSVADKRKKNKKKKTK